MSRHGPGGHGPKDGRGPVPDDPAEQAAAMMSAAGMPRMPARVMMALVAAPGLTAAELAKRLGVSAAAVSGAVRYLQQLHMVHRLSRPGDRRDRYDLIDDGWHGVILGNLPLYLKLADLIDRIAKGGAGAEGASRAHDMAAFFRFLAERMPRLLDEWETERAAGQEG